jgi:phage tail sheath protein FI
MATYQTPGVHFEHADSSRGGIAALRTDVTGFVGIAERGPLHLAIPVESLRQFEAWFGKQIDQGYLAYSARAFFENGGRRLWAVRVASPAASSAYATVFDTIGPAWRIQASSAGNWGNRLSVRFEEVRRVQRRGRVDPLRADRIGIDLTAGFDNFVLIELQSGATRERAIVREADPATGHLVLQRPLVLITPGSAVRVETIAYTISLFDSGLLVAQYANLSTVPIHARYAPALLRQPWVPIDPDRPDEWTGNAPEADVAVEFFRVNEGRKSTINPPLITIDEFRDGARRDALNPFLSVATGPSGATEPVAGGRPVSLAGGADGLAALEVADFTGSGVPANASAEAIIAGRRGIAALDLVDEVSLVAVPDIHIQPRPPHPISPPPPCIPDPCLPGTSSTIRPPIPVGDLPPRFTLDDIALVQMALVQQCELRRDRVALLDAPFDACTRPTFAASDLREWRSRFDTPFAALYAPWLKVSDALLNRGRAGELTRPVPPSGHVAGHCAAIDLRSGVHVAPANVPLRWSQGVTLDIGEDLHGLLNSIGVNAVRSQPGWGIRVLGARTMSSDPDWRYLNVRRLVSMIGEAINLSIQWAVFEPNDWHTRAKLKLAIESFLLMLWSRGALAGAASEEGFRVRCDESNNLSSQRSLGRLSIDVQIAPTKPFEFITLRIGREANGFAISTDEQPRIAA